MHEMLVVQMNKDIFNRVPISVAHKRNRRNYQRNAVIFEGIEKILTLFHPISDGRECRFNAVQ